jgi:uncharacterized protein YecT (DUF1311 family)
MMRRAIPVLAAMVLTVVTSQRSEARDDDPPALSAKALKKLQAGAQTGDPQAELAYAKAIASKDIEGAREWAHKAAAQGSAAAWFWLGYNAVGNQATECFEKAAELGYPEAYEYVLDALLFRAGADADPAKAKKFADLARARHQSVGLRSLEVVDRCFNAGDPKIPAADRPSAVENTSLKNPNGDCLPYLTGIASSRNWGTYRKCLLSQERVDNNSLAEIYANGWGVKRDPKLAIALVCHASDVPAELEGVVESLHATENQAQLKERFLFCDYVTSGLNGGSCADREERTASAARDAEWKELTSDWPAADRALFETLRSAAEAFFAEHSIGEQDMSGTARAAMAIAEEGRLRAELLTTIRAFEKGKRLPEMDFKRADAELNRIYSQVLQRIAAEDSRGVAGTLTREGIRAAEKKWLPYRDAWAAFGAAHYPSISNATWKAWATTQRSLQLRRLLDD